MATEKRLIDVDHLRRYALYEYMRAKMKNKDDYHFEHWAGIVVAMIEELLKGMPTVDAVEVVHGRWEDRENPQWKAYDIRHCSVCGWNIPKSKLRHKDSHWNYCPNCGAKMDGGSDETD